MTDATSCYLNQPLRTELQVRRDMLLSDARRRFAAARQNVKDPNKRIAFTALRSMAVARRQIALLKVGFSLACTSPDFKPRVPGRMTVRDVMRGEEDAE